MIIWRQQYLVWLASVVLSCALPGQMYGSKKMNARENVSKTMQMYSGSFAHETFIPKEYSRKDMNTSPHFEWRNAPEKTQSFALTCVDESAGNFVHWIVFNIPVQITEFSKGFQPSNGILQGQNSFRGSNNWQGPQPPQGTGIHRYLFTLYALDVPELRIDQGKLQEGATYEQVKAALEGHILEEAHFVGLYQYTE